MAFGEAPARSPLPIEAKDMTMHTSMQLGSMILMGCDAPPSERDQAIGGFQIAVDSSDKEQIKRLFAELSAGGSVQSAGANILDASLRNAEGPLRSRLDAKHSGSRAKPINALTSMVAGERYELSGSSQRKRNGRSSPSFWAFRLPHSAKERSREFLPHSYGPTIDHPLASAS